MINYESEVQRHAQKRQAEGRSLCLAGDAGGSLRHALPGGRGRAALRPVPVSQAADEEAGAIYFHCALAGEKYEIFKDGCEAAMSAVSRAEIIPDEYTVAYASAVARGRLEIVTDEKERMRAIKILCMQFDPEAGEKYVSCMKNSGARTCVVRLSVEEITGKEGND